MCNVYVYDCNPGDEVSYHDLCLLSALVATVGDVNAAIDRLLQSRQT